MLLLLFLIWLLQVALVMIGHTDDDVVTDTEINVGRVGRIQCLTARVELMMVVVVLLVAIGYRSSGRRAQQSGQGRRVSGTGTSTSTGRRVC